MNEGTLVLNYSLLPKDFSEKIDAIKAQVMERVVASKSLTFEELISALPELSDGVVALGSGSRNMFFWTGLSASGAVAIYELLLSERLKLLSTTRERYKLLDDDCVIAYDRTTHYAVPHLYLCELVLPGGAGFYPDLRLLESDVLSGVEYEEVRKTVEVLNAEILSAFRRKMFARRYGTDTEYHGFMIRVDSEMRILNEEEFAQVLQDKGIDKLDLEMSELSGDDADGFSHYEWLLVYRGSPLAYEYRRYKADSA